MRLNVFLKKFFLLKESNLLYNALPINADPLPRSWDAWGRLGILGVLNGFFKGIGEC